MKVLVISAHPKRQKSFSFAVVEKVLQGLEKQGHTSFLLDLYLEGFNPVLPLDDLLRGYSLDEQVQSYHQLVEQCDAYVFIHPVWWGGAPAILKGFIDRVISRLVVYAYERGDDGLQSKRILLPGRRALVLCTIDTGPEGPLSHELFWKESIFDFCQISGRIKTFWFFRDSSYRQRRQWLEEIPQYLQFFSLPSVNPEGGSL